MSIDLELEFEQDPRIDSQIIDQTEDQFPSVQPLHISEDIKRYLDSHITDRDDDQSRVEKIQELLYSEEFLHIQYSDERTHTALEAFHARQGNCLSVMNLYIAMARHVGVDAHFQTVGIQPSWDRRGDLLVLSQHINATGKFSARRRYVVDFTPEINLQQLTANTISDREGRALYFNNLGAESLINAEYDKALIYFKNSLFLDPESSITWNNIGTTYNRLGNEELAVYSYHMSFEKDESSAAAINNLAKFYRAAGDFDKAWEYEQAIERFNSRNPYYHFAQGNLAYGEQDLEQARRAFRRALRLKSVEPEFYVALAQVYRDLGNVRRAVALLVEADQLLARNREIYQPSNEKLRIIDAASILNNTTSGYSILAPAGRGIRNP